VIQPVCERGEPHERIVELAEAGSRDLIVLGNRGQSFIERVLIGSVAQRVIGYSSKDVLVVPLSGVIGWDRILLATDGSASCGAAVARALELAQTYGSELLVVSVQDFPGGLRGVVPIERLQLLKICEKHVSEVVNQAQARQLKSQGFVPEGVAYQAIVDLARESRVNLIVMGSHGHTGLSRLLMGRVAERVIGHAPCPVLVVKG